MSHIKEMLQGLSRNRENTINELQQIKKNGTMVVGAYCLFAPYELITAAGALPVSLCGTSEEPIAHAEKHLPRNICPLIKSSYGYAITGTCPYFYYSDLIIGETTCDGKKKMFELLEKITPVHVMRLPQSNNRPEDFEIMKTEIILLKKRLEKDLGVVITDASLKKAIRDRNIERKLCREFYGLSKLDPPPLSGSEIQSVLHGAGYAFDKDDQNKKLRTLIDAVKKAYSNGKISTPANRPRILITGCPVGGSTEKIIQLVEESGGTIVCFENCGGAKDRENLVDETMDPIDALTHKYINLACSCMSPNDNRLKLLSRLMDDYAVDGVIDVVLVACHTYNVETFHIKELVQKKKNKSYLTIETDYSNADDGQLRTRISAFIEMLQE